MQLQGIPFQTIDWAAVGPTTHAGTTGTAVWRTVEVGNARVRLVEYSPGYLADHWCERGHVVHVLEGELATELRDGRTFVTTPGQTYVVADGDGAHRSRSSAGARLFIVD
jgi:quercetin dioxygenase-like cupin family protein